jgi:hypothetical protein
VGGAVEEVNVLWSGSLLEQVHRAFGRSVKQQPPGGSRPRLGGDGKRKASANECLGRSLGWRRCGGGLLRPEFRRPGRRSFDDVVAPIRPAAAAGLPGRSLLFPCPVPAVGIATGPRLPPGPTVHLASR